MPFNIYTFSSIIKIIDFDKEKTGLSIFHVSGYYDDFIPYSREALMKSLKSGCGLIGLDLNSG